MIDERTKKAMHILRNPFGWDTEERRRAAEDACKAIERLHNAYENMKQFAEDNGLDTTCYGNAPAQLSETQRLKGELASAEAGIEFWRGKAVEIASRIPVPPNASLTGSGEGK